MSPVRVWWVGWNADHLGSGRGTPCVPPSRSEPSPLPGRSGLRTGGEWSFRVWSLRSLFGQALTYLLSDIHHISEGCVRPIRSAADKCSVPHTHNTFGDRIFTSDIQRLPAFSVQWVTGLLGAMCWYSWMAIGTNFLSPVTKNKASGTHSWNTHTQTV